MNKNRILAKLESMVGHQYMIDGHTERIMLYSMTDTTITVETDRRKRSFSEDQFMEWVKSCLPVEDDLIVIKESMGNKNTLPAFKNETQVSTMVYKPSFGPNNFSELREILMKNIEQVQGNKEYLAQATAVRDNVQSVIELTKNEIEYAKIVNRMSR